MGGGLNIFCPRRSLTGTKSDGGGTCEKNPTEAETAHLMHNKAISCYFKHEIQLFKVLMSLKVVKFDTKMYQIFQFFWDEPQRGGGQALVQKLGQVSDGGIDKIFARWGNPPEKKLRSDFYYGVQNLKNKIKTNVSHGQQLNSTHLSFMQQDDI